MTRLKITIALVLLALAGPLAAGARMPRPRR